METIVVGIDGSDGAKAALAFAAHEAALRRATLRIVTVWQVPYAAYAGGLMPPANLPALVRDEAEQTAADAATAAEELEPGIYCEHVAVEGQPAEVLVRESADAGLVVVGTRGHGGFASLLLGSVSHQVVQHAACPVTVVPPGVAAS
jgi:nucleotide-binding universal stress UspA family protein